MMWLYHCMRYSVSPQHATAWIAVQTIATVLGFLAAGTYVVLTYQLWREATGMRMGELVALRYDRINWRGGYVTVNRAWVRGQLTTPKNGKKRTVKISRDLRTVLYLRYRRHRTSELVFPSAAGTHLDHHNFRNHVWKPVLRAAELDYRKPHAMRHTKDSLLLQRGASPAKVPEEAGRTLTETMKTYAHFLPGGNRDEAELLSGLLNPRTERQGSKDTVSSDGRFRLARATMGNDC